MSRIAFLSASLLALPILALPVSAQDANTYRSGTPYMSSPASGSQMCASQCQGDAQCKGWNFLRSGAPNGSGMCEFNSALAAAVPHPYAISGQNQTAGYAGGSVVSAGTNVTRIGQPITVVPQAQVRPQTLQASTRPVPRQIASAQRPQTRTRTFAPQTSVQPRVQARPIAKPATLGGPLQAVRPNLPTARQAPTSVYAPMQAQIQARPTVQPQRHPVVNAPAQPRPLPANAPQTPVATQATSPQTYAEAATRQSGLYGSLYDDVTQPKPQAPTPPTYSEYQAPRADSPVSTKAVPIAVPAANILEVPLADVSPLAGGL